MCWTLRPLRVTAVLVLVVAGHAQRVARTDHGHHTAQYARAVRAAVDEVAHEDGRTAGRVHAVLVAQLAEQRLQFGSAAVDVTDDVEGAGEVGQVVVALLRADLGALDLLHATQDVHLAESLALQVAQGAAEFADVAVDDPAGHVGPVGAGGVAFGADVVGHVEDDGDGQDVVLPGQLDQLLSAALLDVGRVDDRTTARRESLARDVVQDVEGVPAGALVVLVVGDQASAEVRGDDLGRPEVPPGESGLARAGRPDQDDEGEVGDGQHTSLVLDTLDVLGALDTAHAAFASFSLLAVSVSVLIVNTAICVGGPTSGSSGPTGTNSVS